MPAVALRAPERPPAAPARGPGRAAIGAGLLSALAAVIGVAIVAAILGTGPSACQPPAASAPASVPAPGTNGGELRGKVSWFGGPRDAMSGPTTASGLPVTRPGIAVYNTQTLRGYWWVRFPNRRAAILQQTDVGPAPWTGRVLDVLYSALPALGYSERSFPTDGQIVAAYLGRDASWAASAVGGTRDAACARPAGARPARSRRRAPPRTVLVVPSDRGRTPRPQGLMRDTVSSPQFATHTAPAPTATP